MAFSTNLRGLRFVAMAVLVRNKYDAAVQAAEPKADQDISDKAPVPEAETERQELHYPSASVKRLKFI